MDMLKADDPTVVVKENAFAKLATKLLERELQERADPALAAKRALKGTPVSSSSLTSSPSSPPCWPPLQRQSSASPAGQPDRRCVGDDKVHSC